MIVALNFDPMLRLATSPHVQGTGEQFEYDIRLKGAELRSAALANLGLTARDRDNALELFLDTRPVTATDPLLYISADDTLSSIRATEFMVLRVVGRGDYPSVFITRNLLRYLRHPAEFRLVRGNFNSGSFGEISVIRETASGRLYAQKRLFSPRAGERHPSQVIYFREMSTQLSIFHPAILSLQGIMEEDFHPILLTRFCENGSVGDLLRESIPLSITARWIIIVGTAEGMRILHERLIVHRDLKPDNVLLDDRRWPLVCDFGHSRQLDGPCAEFSSTDVGTIGYQSPELIEGKSLSRPVDVFAFGMLMYSVLTGKFPSRELGDGIAYLVQTAIFEGKRPKIPPMSISKSRK
jgi:serine/threonine protein kinase